MSEVKVNKISPRTGTDVELNSSAKITNFTSTGIDDNASSTAVTIDSSNRLLVGKTSAGTSTVGAELRNTGLVTGTVDGSHCSNFNRLTSDGEVIRIQRDGTTVGKIEASSSGISIYLGGTGSANALDDYEEGSFTPSLDIETGSNISVTTIQGYYRKIGNLVAFNIFCIWDKTAGSANMKFSGLPFTCSNQTNLSSQAVNWLQGAYTDPDAFFGGRVFGSSTDVYFVDSKHGSFNSNFDTNNAGRIANTTGIRSYVNGTYFTT